MSSFPFEIIYKIYKFADVDTKISLNKIFDHNSFYRKADKYKILNRYTKKFLKYLNQIISFKISHIEVLNKIEGFALLL